MSDCLFCKIAAGELNTDFVYEDKEIVAFNDINPKANIHILVVPRIHIENLAEINSVHTNLMNHLLFKLKDIAADNGLKDGFRTIINTKAGGGQEINHIHFHLLGGGNLPKF